jgi:hypothetical protein
VGARERERARERYTRPPPHPRDPAPLNMQGSERERARERERERERERCGLAWGVSWGDPHRGMRDFFGLENAFTWNILPCRERGSERVSV